VRPHKQERRGSTPKGFYRKEETDKETGGWIDATPGRSKKMSITMGLGKMGRGEGEGQWETLGKALDIKGKPIFLKL